jgi:hypothetical protein
VIVHSVSQGMQIQIVHCVKPAPEKVEQLRSKVGKNINLQTKHAAKLLQRGPKRTQGVRRM